MVRVIAAHHLSSPCLLEPILTCPPRCDHNLKRGLSAIDTHSVVFFFCIFLEIFSSHFYLVATHPYFDSLIGRRRASQ